MLTHDFQLDFGFRRGANPVFDGAFVDAFVVYGHLRNVIRTAAQNLAAVDQCAPLKFTTFFFSIFGRGQGR